LKLHKNGVVRLVTLSEVVYLKGEGNYTTLILSDFSMYTMRKILKKYESELGLLFFRCNKSYLINYDYIKEINKRNHQILLTTGTEIPFSRYKLRLIKV
jgi:DNA-binding LytR/AlgR family response regulator